MQNPRAIVAVLLCVIILAFVVSSAVITLRGVGINDQGLAFWKEFLLVITGALAGYIGGSAGSNDK
jgi:hypothetical protein